MDSGLAATCPMQPSMTLLRYTKGVLNQLHPHRNPELKNGRPPLPLLQKDLCHHAAGEAEVVAEEDVIH